MAIEEYKLGKVKHYLYQMYDESLETWVLSTVLSSTPEQTAYSCRSLCVKQPEKNIDKVSCVLYVAGEIDTETGEIELYKDKSLVFDYRVIMKKYLESIKEKTNVGEES